MTLSAVSNRKVVAELWVSLISLIRSYVAGHELGKPADHAAVATGKDGRFTVESGGRTLAIECTADCETTGLGEWRLLEDDSGHTRILDKGSFRIGMDSTVEFSDRKGKLDLEVAAEAFTARIFDED